MFDLFLTMFGIWTMFDHNLVMFDDIHNLTMFDHILTMFDR